MEHLSTLKFSSVVKKYFILSILTFLICVSVCFYIFLGNETTDNAYVKGNVTLLSPRITGYIKDVFVINNQEVKKGDLLVELDDTEYKAAYALQLALVKQREGEVQSCLIKSSQQQDIIQKAEQQQLITQNEGGFQQKELKRAQELKKNEFASTQKLDQSQVAYNKALSQNKQAKESFEYETKQLDVLKLEVQKAQALLEQAKANLELARQNLQDAKIIAPQDGIIAQRSVQTGQYVRAGLGLMYLIPKNQLWVEANFKETQMKTLKVGQNVKISIDAFSKPFYGTISSFSPATGSEFSLLPSENATGNFTKIVRRIPVRIHFDEGQDLSHVAPGYSCFVKIYIK